MLSNFQKYQIWNGTFQDKASKRSDQNEQHTIPIKGYALAFIFGVIGGGILVAVIAKAIPGMMSGMMQNMMLQMRKNGFNPGET